MGSRDSSARWQGAPAQAPSEAAQRLLARREERLGVWLLHRGALLPLGGAQGLPTEVTANTWMSSQDSWEWTAVQRSHPHWADSSV